MSPSQGSLLVMVSKPLEKLSYTKIRKTRVVLCLELLKDKGTSQKALESPNLQHRNICKTRTREGHQGKTMVPFLSCLPSFPAGWHGSWLLQEGPGWRQPFLLGIIPCPSSPWSWSSSQPYLKQQKMPMARSSAASDVE